MASLLFNPAILVPLQPLQMWVEIGPLSLLKGIQALLLVSHANMTTRGPRTRTQPKKSSGLSWLGKQSEKMPLFRMISTNLMNESGFATEINATTRVISREHSSVVGEVFYRLEIVNGSLLSNLSARLEGPFYHTSFSRAKTSWLDGSVVI
mgnify:FL=1